MTGDTTPIEWSEYYESYQPPYELKIKAWTDGTIYDHTITVRVAILPKKALVSASVAEAIKNVFQLLSPKRVDTKG